MDTYLMGWPRSTLSHVAASTSIFLTVVNAIVAGTLGALVTDAAGAASAVVVVVGRRERPRSTSRRSSSSASGPSRTRQDARFPTPGRA